MLVDCSEHGEYDVFVRFSNEHIKPEDVEKKLTSGYILARVSEESFIEFINWEDHRFYILDDENYWSEIELGDTNGYTWIICEVVPRWLGSMDMMQKQIDGSSSRI